MFAAAESVSLSAKNLRTHRARISPPPPNWANNLKLKRYHCHYHHPTSLQTLVNERTSDCKWEIEREREKEKIAHLGTGEDTVLRIASINWAARLSLKVLNERMREWEDRAIDRDVSQTTRWHQQCLSSLECTWRWWCTVCRHRVTISALCHRSTGGSLFWFASQAALWQPPPFPAAAKVEFGGGLHWKEVSKDEQSRERGAHCQVHLPPLLLIQTLHF